MRTLLALAFIVLIAGSFASKKKHIQESKLVSSLKGLFQLATEDEFSDVADILAEVRGEIESLLANVQSNYAQEASDAESVIDGYESTLENIANEISDTNADIEAEQSAAGQLEDAISSAVSAIADAQAQQDAENARRTDYHNAFRAQVDQLNDAVDAAEDALRLLQEIDTQDLSGSFLEINNKKIKANFEHIHKTLKNMKLSNSVIPMTRILVEIASAGVNHDLIAQLEDLLGQLVDILNSEVDAAVQDDNNDDAYSRSTLANLQSTIDSQSEAAEANQAQLDEVNEQLSDDESALGSLGNAFQQGQAQLQEAQAAWSDKADDYEALIDRLEADIEAIEAAEKFVDRSSSSDSESS